MRKKMLIPPFPYYGGKRRPAPEIWRRIGPVRNFVDPFFGGGGAFLQRPDWQGTVETINDLDSLLVNFWRAVRGDPAVLAEVAAYPISELDLNARHTWLIRQRGELQEAIRADPNYYDAQVAAWWVWGICQWIGGGWCKEWRQQRPHRRHRGNQRPMKDFVGIHRQGRPRAKLQGVHSASHADTLIEYFEALAHRLQRVRILSGDWTRLVTPAMTWGNGLTGVFLDPPYSVDRDEVYAEDSFTVAQDVRAWAVENGGNPSLRIALCGHPEEHDMPSEWAAYDWKQDERIWFSPYCLQPSRKGSTTMTTAVLVPPTKQLTDIQRHELNRIEDDIARNLKASFDSQLALGRALLEIKRKGLYIPRNSVTEYAERTWGLKKQETSRLIRAAEVMEQLSGDHLPSNLGQTEALYDAGRRKKDISEVWAAVASTGKKPTAKAIETAAGKKPQKPAAPAEPEPAHSVPHETGPTYRLTLTTPIADARHEKFFGKPGREGTDYLYSKVTDNMTLGKFFRAIGGSTFSKVCIEVA